MFRKSRLVAWEVIRESQKQKKVNICLEMRFQVIAILMKFEIAVF